MTRNLKTDAKEIGVMLGSRSSENSWDEDGGCQTTDTRKSISRRHCSRRRVGGKLEEVCPADGEEAICRVGNSGGAGIARGEHSFEMAGCRPLARPADSAGDCAKKCMVRRSVAKQIRGSQKCSFRRIQT